MREKQENEKKTKLPQKGKNEKRKNGSETTEGKWKRNGVYETKRMDRRKERIKEKERGERGKVWRLTE